LGALLVAVNSDSAVIYTTICNNNAAVTWSCYLKAGMYVIVMCAEIKLETLTVY